jgi:hypothetical protein
MNELENLVFRNGKWYDKRTSNRVFMKDVKKQYNHELALEAPTINDNNVEGANAPPEGDNATESVTGGLEATLETIVKPPVKRTGGRPKKQTT